MASVSGDATVPARHGNSCDTQAIYSPEITGLHRSWARRGVDLPTFASPIIAGVTLHDTDQIYGVYRERMIKAQEKHLDFFKQRMGGE
jgi:hypothetical protein